MPANTLSAILPVFNRFEYLTACLESVFSQRPRADEILIVDGCSSAPVSDFIATTRFQGSVHVLRTDRNRRIAGARNWGWRHARGNLIAFLDSDDLWEPYKT